MACGLTTAQREAFARDGFLAIESLLDEEDLQPLEAEYAAVLDRAARELHAAGEISSPFEGLCFGERYTRILSDYPGLYRSAAIRWSLDLRYSPVGLPTGRPAFPGFVARSRAKPASELRDPVEWKRRWDRARDAILSGAYEGPIFEEARWRANAGSQLCA